MKNSDHPQRARSVNVVDPDRLEPFDRPRTKTGDRTLEHRPNARMGPDLFDALLHRLAKTNRYVRSVLVDKVVAELAYESSSARG